MSAEEEARAVAFRQQEIRRLRYRQAQGRRLAGSRLARNALQVNWRPIRDMLSDRKGQGGPGGGADSGRAGY